jgi:AcrR family transcriptional regulator
VFGFEEAAMLRIPKPDDRRVKRTRGTVMHTFISYLFQRPYDSISVGDVLEGADVGRATFYSHYRNKDDLLIQSVAVIMEVFADCYIDLVRGSRDVSMLVALLEHFRENRLLLRRMTTGTAAHAFARSMDRTAGMFETRLVAWCDETGQTLTVAPSLAARSLSDGLFGMIRAWLEDDTGACSATDLAGALRALAVSATRALIRSESD